MRIYELLGNETPLISKASPIPIRSSVEDCRHCEIDGSSVRFDCEKPE